MAKKRRPAYKSRKSPVLRVFIVVIAVALLLGIIILPLRFSLRTSATMVDGISVTVEEFETGRLSAALREAADGTDYNDILYVAVSGGTLNFDDYDALNAIPNLSFLELAGAQTQSGIIPPSALRQRNRLQYISLPNNTMTIGAYAFSSNRLLKKVDMPYSVEEIGEYAFEYCEELSVIPISENIKRIGEGAFRDCKAMTSFTIPSGVREIRANTFSKNGFTEIHIGPDVTFIGDDAFADCDKLRNIYAYSVNPPRTGADAFKNVSATVHVYEGSAVSYESWAANNIRITEDLTGEYTLTALIPPEADDYAQTAADVPEETQTAQADETDEMSEENPAETTAAATEPAEEKPAATEAAAQTQKPEKPAENEAEKEKKGDAGTVILIILLIGASGASAYIIIKEKPSKKEILPTVANGFKDGFWIAVQYIKTLPQTVKDFAGKLIQKHKNKKHPLLREDD